MDDTAAEAQSDTHPMAASDALEDAASVAPEAAKKFSLGAAVLGFLQAENCFSPTQLPPGPWLLCFTEQHADAAVWAGLFSSCRGGRELALTHARKATLMLRCANRPPDAGWRAQVAAVRQALRVRGARPTRVDLEPASWFCKDPDSYVWLVRLAIIPGQLLDVSAGVTELYFRGCSNSTAIAALATTFPNITHFKGPQVPPPSYWPRLTSLVLRSVDGYTRAAEKALWSLVAPYLPQLTTLELPQCHYPSGGVIPWRALFPRELATNLPLTTFTTHEVLTDKLLSKLLTHTPHLEQLTVWGLAVSAEGFRDRVWRVKRLNVAYWVTERSSVLPAVAALPRLSSGRAVLTRNKAAVRSAAVVNVRSLEARPVKGTWLGFDRHIATCMASWCLDVVHMVVQCDGLPSADQPAALRRTLQQLADMQAPDAVVWLQGWQWSDQLADIVADSLPALQHLRFGVRLAEPLTDQLLAAVLRMGPHMRRLSVPCLALQPDHDGVGWQVTELILGEFDIGQLLRLPSQLPGSSQLQLRPHILPMAPCISFSEAELTRLYQVLSRVSFRARDEPESWGQEYRKKALTIRVQGQGLERQCAVLGALRTDLCGCGVQVQVIKCNMDQSAVTALLAVLPQDGLLDLHFLKCTWPLAAMDYKALGYSLPVLSDDGPSWTGNQIIVMFGGHCEAVARRLCEGLLQREREKIVQPVTVYTTAIPESRNTKWYSEEVSVLGWPDWHKMPDEMPYAWPELD